jgi:BirA family biotin operon repressor/biotin-[acetyl-CoA-carboxylase] ligase
LSQSKSPPSPIPDEFAEPLARAGDRLGVFSHQQFLWYTTVPSTNDLAGALAERGAREGCAVIAEAQSAGRGRHGRTWSSPPGAGLYISTILRPPTQALSLLTIAAGVAVAEAVQAATGLDPRLKWPNDVYVGEGKLAGVLAEAGSMEEGEPDEDLPRLRYVVLGIGINVMPAPHPPDVAARATSIEAELGRSIDRGLLLTECLVRLSARYEELRHKQTEGILTAWRARSAATLGRTVEWDASGVRRGIAEGIDDDGALLVRTESGLERLISGEVRWI